MKSTIKIYLFLIFVLLVKLQSTPNWNVSPSIDAGLVAYYSGQISYYSTASFNNSKTYPFKQNMHKTLPFTPSIILGLTSFQFSKTNSSISYIIIVFNQTKTSFACNLTIFTTSTIISKMNYMFFAVTISSFNSAFFLTTSNFTMNNISINNGIRKDNYNVSITNYNISHNLQVFTSFNGFSIDPNGSFYELYAKGSVINQTTLSVQFGTSQNTIVTSVTLSIMVYDITLLQQAFIYFIDYGIIYGENGSQTSPPSKAPVLNYYNSLIGLSYMIFDINQILNFDAQSIYTIITTNTTFIYLQMYGMQLRVRNCLSPDLYYIPQSGLCNNTCQKFYFHNSYLYCQKCTYSCLNCSNTQDAACPNYCITTLYFRIYDSNDNSCNCISGYYSDSINELCIICQYSCQTCQQSAAKCTLCRQSDFRILIVNDCNCIVGYFDDNSSNNVCQKCSYKCQTCLNFNYNCLTCIVNNFRNLNINDCTCIEGYFDNNTQICAKCNQICKTCSGSQKVQCLSCDIKLNRYLLNNQCSCIDKFYEVNLNTCAPCDYSCSTCIQNSLNCSSCSQLNHRILNGSNCICLNQYFDFGVQICAICSITCNQCINNYTYCLNCRIGSERYLLKNSCVCSSKFYESMNQICSPCSPLCQNCSMSSVNCTSCDLINSHRTLNNNLCVCIDNYYQNNLICQKCDRTCQTCNINSTNCLTCSMLNLRIFNQINSCICNIGYFDDGISSLCIKCSYTCLTCSNNDFNCTSCQSAYFRQLNNQKCLCSIGYYDDGKNQNCLLCNQNCYSCNINPSNCTQCISNTNKILNQNNCICIDHFYNQNNICILCNSECLTCNGPATNNCLSCDPLKFKALNIISHVCQCLLGYYLDSITITCKKCDSICITCFKNSLNCTAGCQTQVTYRQLKNNQCTCIQNYYDIGSNVCSKCDLNCENCDKISTNCTSCSIGSILQNYKCICIEAYYYNSQSICIACQYTCKNCDSNPSNCTQCYLQTNRIFLLNTFSLNYECTCLNGYTQIGKSVCQKSELQCDYSCETCFNNFQCRSCSFVKNRQYNNDTALCSCKPYYYQLSGQQYCPQICGDGINLNSNLSFCDDGNLVNNDGCSSNCMIQNDWICQNDENKSSFCIFNGHFQIQVQSCIKQQNSNNVDMVLKIIPAVVQLNSLVIQDFMSILSNISMKSMKYTYSGGRLLIKIQYNEDLESKNLSIKINANAVSKSFSQSSVTQISIKVSSTNNMPILYYSDNLYSKYKIITVFVDIFQYISLIIFMISLYFNPLIGVEFIGIIQLSFICLSYVKSIPALLYPFVKMKYINGINIPINSVESLVNINKNFECLGYETYMIGNFNLMILSIIVTFCVGIIIKQINKRYYEGGMRQKLDLLSQELTYQKTCAIMMFNLYQISISIGIDLKYSVPNNSLNTYSILLITTLVIFYITLIYNLISKNNMYGSFVQSFKSDNNYYKKYIFCLILYRFIVGFILSTANQNNSIAYGIFVLPILNLILLIVFKPYIHVYNNARSIINQIILIVFLAYYSSLRSSDVIKYTQDGLAMLIPFFLLGLILLLIIINTGTSIIVKLQIQKQKYKISPSVMRFATEQSIVGQQLRQKQIRSQNRNQVSNKDAVLVLNQ